MDFKEYKKYHEQHMMNNTGTSIQECLVLLSTIPFCIFLYSYISLYFSKSFCCIFQFSMIILPTILNCTVLSNVNHIIFINLILLSLTILFLKIDLNTVKNLLSTKLENNRSLITNYRASTNFFSAICILAVDFVIFPKRLAKTESFGFGFMDLGVGFFICSNGFVEKHKVNQGQFMKLLKTELILCILGLIRVFSVKSIDYHEHVSEYGVHWNFFFTLALCRLLSYLILLISNNADPFWLSIITGLTHQIFLELGLQKWVLSNKPRDSFITANREGLVSSLGYISLYFAASATGKYLLNLKDLTYKTLLFNLIIGSSFMWIGTAVSLKFFDVSRRLINMGYIFWVLALSLTEIILFVIVEISSLSLQKKRKTPDISVTVPNILESINAYGLMFFILSNLLTGLINSVFQTLLLGKIMSMFLIISYMIILCITTYFLFQKKIGFNYKF